MTNREWLLNKIQNMSDGELACILANENNICKIMNKKCVGGDCTDCILPWLKQEHKEKIILLEAERIILENIDKHYNWIARDKNGTLYAYERKPKKEMQYDNWDDKSDGDIYKFYLFNHLFQFITWNDSEPYNIEELLKQ